MDIEGDRGQAVIGGSIGVASVHEPAGGKDHAGEGGNGGRAEGKDTPKIFLGYAHRLTEDYKD
jgi:hypothetical protein